MNEKEMRIISVSGSILSLFAIYLLVTFLVPEGVGVCDLDYSMRGQILNVTGYVKDYHEKDGNVFFTLYDETCEIRVVLWEDVVKSLHLKNSENLSMKDGTKISIMGEVMVYSGSLELVPSSPSGVNVM